MIQAMLLRLPIRCQSFCLGVTTAKPWTNSTHLLHRMICQAGTFFCSMKFFIHVYWVNPHDSCYLTVLFTPACSKKYRGLTTSTRAPLNMMRSRLLTIYGTRTVMCHQRMASSAVTMSCRTQTSSKSSSVAMKSWPRKRMRLSAKMSYFKIQALGCSRPLNPNHCSRSAS